MKPLLIDGDIVRQIAESDRRPVGGWLESAATVLALYVAWLVLQAMKWAGRPI